MYKYILYISLYMYIYIIHFRSFWGNYMFDPCMTCGLHAGVPGAPSCSEADQNPHLTKHSFDAFVGLIAQSSPAK